MNDMDTIRAAFETADTYMLKDPVFCRYPNWGTQPFSGYLCFGDKDYSDDPGIIIVDSPDEQDEAVFIDDASDLTLILTVGLLRGLLDAYEEARLERDEAIRNAKTAAKDVLEILKGRML